MGSALVGWYWRAWTAIQGCIGASLLLPLLWVGRGLLRIGMLGPRRGRGRVVHALRHHAEGRRRSDGAAKSCLGGHAE